MNTKTLLYERSSKNNSQNPWRIHEHKTKSIGAKIASFMVLVLTCNLGTPDPSVCTSLYQAIEGSGLASTSQSSTRESRPIWV